MSIAGGIHRAVERGAQAGCAALQIFLKNSNQWRARSLGEEDRALFAEARRRCGIGPVLAHSGYLINLASPEDALSRRSLDALVGELVRANYLEVPGLILHPGAHRGAGEKSGIAAVSAALNRAFETVPPPVSVLLENTAGQGTSVGHSFEQLAEILDGVRRPERIGFCLDTCHLFAAGYGISTEEGYFETLQRFDRLIGCPMIRAFHVNDSRKPLGSRVDRHHHIGKGCIGLEAFRCLMNDRRFGNVPKILETPKGDDLKLDRMNLATLRRLAT
jgi:deoxyribonuclease-4